MGPPLVVVMGVSGVGKTVVGEAVAARWAVEYADGDEFHSPHSVAKMTGGTPLSDADRVPWLRRIGGWLHERVAVGGVVSCSALRRSYRALLVEAAPSTCFLQLTAEVELIRSRLEGREHFMPPALLETQVRTLEPLAVDEVGVALDASQSVEAIVAEFVEWRESGRAGR